MAGLDGSDISTTVYIDDLVPGNPVTTDPKSQGDDHIRFTKRVLKNTFQGGDGNGLSGPVTASHTELNILDGATVTTAELNVLDGIPGTLTATELGYVDGVTSAIQTQIDNLKKFDIQFNLDTGANGDYTLVQDAQFGFTIDSAYYRTASGTIAVAVKISTNTGTSGTAVTSLSALSLSSTEGNATATGLNAVSAGNTVMLTTSSNSSATKISLLLHCTRS